LNTAALPLRNRVIWSNEGYGAFHADFQKGADTIGWIDYARPTQTRPVKASAASPHNLERTVRPVSRSGEEAKMTNSLRTRAVRTNCFDASALVKVYTDEDESVTVRKYFNSEPNKYTTPICYFETLNVLKKKRFERKPPNNITDDGYHKAAFELSAWFSASSKNVPDVDLVDPITFPQVQSIARKYSVDLSDAFQILSVKKGFASIMIGESQTILVAADEGLASAARSEVIKVWYVMKEQSPA
jgi:predicted nucleic acid-binding protein